MMSVHASRVRGQCVATTTIAPDIDNPCKVRFTLAAVAKSSCAVGSSTRSSPAWEATARASVGRLSFATRQVTELFGGKMVKPEHA